MMKAGTMALTPTKRRQLSLWIQGGIALAVVIVVSLLMDWKAIYETFFRFGPAAEEMFPKIFVTGFMNTLLYTFTSFAFGLILGLILALMKLSSFAPYRWIATFYIELFRGLPALLTLAAVGLGVPLAIPAARSLPTWVLVMIGLGMVAAAYIAETIRAGIEAVPPGQFEAARSLGMSQTRAMVTIVVPQALRIVLPPLTNEFILLTKDSSLAFVVGFQLTQMELTSIGRGSLVTAGAGITPLVIAGLFYLLITVPLSFVVRWFEKKTNQSSRQKKKSTSTDTEAIALTGAQR